MKIIITESQYNFLRRRYHDVEDILNNIGVADNSNLEKDDDDETISAQHNKNTLKRIQHDQRSCNQGLCQSVR